jgi:hypothetical protein
MRQGSDPDPGSNDHRVTADGVSRHPWDHGNVPDAPDRDPIEGRAANVATRAYADGTTAAERGI